VKEAIDPQGADLVGRLISVAVAARRLQRCPATVRHWLKTGKIAGVRYPSGQYAVSAAAIEKILSQSIEVS